MYFLLIKQYTSVKWCNTSLSSCESNQIALGSYIFSVSLLIKFLFFYVTNQNTVWVTLVYSVTKVNLPNVYQALWILCSSFTRSSIPWSDLPEKCQEKSYKSNTTPPQISLSKNNKSNSWDLRVPEELRKIFKSLLICILIR